MSHPVPLSGGRQTTSLTRDGDTTRRPRSARADSIVLLLRELRTHGFTGAPRVVDPDERGDLVLEWIAGRTIVTSPFGLSEAQVRSAARLIRAFHDASVACTLAGGAEIVAHGDLGPHNIVFEGEDAVGIIDWDDGIGPGTRANDVAHAAWCCADLVDELVPVERQRILLQAFCAEYGSVSPSTVLDELEARFLRARDEHAAAGRDDAARIFAELGTQLRESRSALL